MDAPLPARFSPFEQRRTRELQAWGYRFMVTDEYLSRTMGEIVHLEVSADRKHLIADKKDGAIGNPSSRLPTIAFQDLLEDKNWLLAEAKSRGWQAEELLETLKGFGYEDPTFAAKFRDDFAKVKPVASPLLGAGFRVTGGPEARGQVRFSQGPEATSH